MQRSPAAGSTPEFFPSYSPALDGLRCLAVLAVMLYHGGVDAFRGGFLGVDVFLVLSGFLITTLLAREHDRGGTIGLRSFYARRARRLLPALGLVLAATAFYTVAFVPVAQRASVRGDAIASLVYVQNWRLVLTHESYFAQFAAPSPLRHVWSLSIEEQWYVVFPVLLIGLIALTRRRHRVTAVALAGLAVASAVAMRLIYQPGTDPSRVYYGTDTRAQALLVGAAVAMWCAVSPPSRVRMRQWVAAGAVVGAIVLGWVVTHTHDTSESLYRGGMTLFAVASVAVVVGALVPGPAKWLLERRPLPAIGRISYGLYLWHWPVFLTMTPARMHLDGTPLLAARFAVSFAVSIASYVFVERPVRHGTLRTRLPRRSLSVVVAATVAVALIAATAYARVPSPSAADRRTALPSPADPAAARRPSAADEPRAAAAHAPRVLVAGDSVAFTLAYWGPSPRVAAQLSISGAAILGCGIVVGPIVSEGKTIKASSECKGWEDRYRRAVERSKPDVSVLMIGAWEVFDRIVDGQTLRVGTPAMERYLIGQLDTAGALLTANGARLVVLNVPCYRPPDLQLGTAGSAERADEHRIAWVNGVLERYVAAHPPAAMLDLRGRLCPGGTFLARHDGKPLRTDDGIHLTQDGARYVWDWLAPRLEQLAGRAS